MLTRQQIPNLLTFARVAAVPLCLAIILFDPPGKPLALFCIFVAASITDFFDGYLARKWNAVSPIGALLDPVADKLLVALMLVYLCTFSSNVGHISGAPVWITMPLLLPTAVIIMRELYISGLREFLAARQISLPVSKGGKWKTALQMIALASLLFYYAFEPTIANCPSVGVAADDIAWSGCPQRKMLTSNAQVIGIRLLYVAALLAVTSAISYTRASVKQLRAAK